MAKRKSTK